MSTKTNFKRIALVAVAALGLGVLSSVPSQAAPSLTYTSAYDTTNGVQTVGGVAKVTVALDAGVRTQIAITGVGSVISETTTGGATSTYVLGAKTWLDTTTAAGQTDVIELTSTEAGTTTITMTPLNANGSAGTPVVKTVTWTATGSLAVSSASAKLNSYAHFTAGSAWSSLSDTTIALSYDKAAGSNLAAVGAKFLDSLGNAVSGATVVVTISGPGVLSAAATSNETATTTANSSNRAFSMTTGAGGTVSTAIGSDGSAGTATVTFTSGTVSVSKSVTFTGSAARYALYSPVGALAVGANGTDDTKTSYVVRVAPYDNATAGNLTVAGTTFYAFSADPTIATVVASAHTTLANQYGYIAVTGVKAGKTKITIGNASTLAASTVTASIDVEVTSSVASTVTMAFDKSSYAPGEAGNLKVTLTNAAGRPVADGTYTIFGALTPLSVNKPLTANSVNATSYTDGAVSVTTVGGVAQLDFFAPVTAGNITITATTLATGTAALTGTALGKALTATASVTDSGAAALAAVTALATTVASLKTLIVTLTNLVLKIQKKVKA